MNLGKQCFSTSWRSSQQHSRWSTEPQSSELLWRTHRSLEDRHTDTHTDKHRDTHTDTHTDMHTDTQTRTDMQAQTCRHRRITTVTVNKVKHGPDPSRACPLL